MTSAGVGRAGSGVFCAGARWLRGAMGVAVALAGVCAAPSVGAQAASGGGIYTCVDGRGNRITSDRPIPQCLDREQALRNSDGSVRRTVGPSLTAEERAVYEEAQRKRLARESSQRDAVRKDRNLLVRYPNEAAHQNAREAGLQPIVAALRITSQRLEELHAEARRLVSEGEFYRGRAVPRALLARSEANLSAISAQQQVLASHQSELKRLTLRYDTELQHLRSLWAGAPLGQWSASMSALPP